MRGGRDVGRLSFFNDKDYGPYRGSIIAIVSEEWPMERIFVPMASMRWEKREMSPSAFARPGPSREASPTWGSARP